MKRLDGRVAWVTGAGRGIGRAVALGLATEGASVALTSRSTQELNDVRKLIEQHGGRALVAPADLCDPAAIAGAARSIERTFGRVDVLINNAGIGRFAPVRDMKLDDFDAMWALNVRAVFLCTQAVLAGMEERREGTIVNISSLAGKNAFVNGAGYAATKWALNGFSGCLRLEARRSNVRVITVNPGSVATGFSSSASDPERKDRILSPDDVASAVIAAVTLPARSMMSDIDLRPTNPG